MKTAFISSRRCAGLGLSLLLLAGCAELDPADEALIGQQQSSLHIAEVLSPELNEAATNADEDEDATPADAAHSSSGARQLAPSDARRAPSAQSPEQRMGEPPPLPWHRHALEQPSDSPAPPSAQSSAARSTSP